METVVLKSKVGPQEVCIRKDRASKQVVRWEFDNDFRAAVPLWWWESIQNSYLIPEDSLRYKDAFIPL